MKKATVRQPEAKRQHARADIAHVDGLTRTELELPDGRYLLDYARAPKKPHA